MCYIFYLQENFEPRILNFMAFKPLPYQNAQRVFNGIRFDVYSLLLSNKSGKNISKEVVVHPGAVIILPILNANEIVFIRNERFAVGKDLWELPAGTLEPSELPINTAARELIEETGFQAAKLEPLNTFYTSPGICNEIMYAFAAYDLKHVGQKLDESEKITVEILKWEKALQMIHSGEICDGKTIATLLYFYTFNKSL